ncbi:MAG: hypothetical protein ACRENI_10105 [Gemmatimonadaceae bacterium]
MTSTLAALMTLALLAASSSALAQHEQMAPMHDMTGTVHRPLGIPMTRDGSGTTWLPDASPMNAYHFTVGAWELMAHGVAYLQYDRQYSDRGDDQFGSINWGMLMASRNVGRGWLQLRTMLSAEPWTIGSEGYPLLLQTGETFNGEPLHDRQHPHDLFMELAALYEREIAPGLAMQLYLAPVGEPVVGPVAFPHRPSATSDPFAPLGHHWQDATHITFGVITAGIFTRRTKLEGSIFNGREPDEERTGFDYDGRSLDSYAGRITVNPSDNWSMSASYAFLESPEALEPEESVHRTGASVLHTRRLGARTWASALVFGANRHEGENRWEPSVLAETMLALDSRNTVFGRVEYVEKGAGDLVLGPDVAAEHVDIGSFVAGYVRDLGERSAFGIAAGVRGSVNIIPASLEETYGTRTPGGFTIFLRLRPPRMHMVAGAGHDGMNMQGEPDHR